MIAYLCNKKEFMAYILRILSEVVAQATAHSVGMKQVLLANDETTSAVTQIAKSKLNAGDKVDEHIHPTMDEHYLCFSGSGILWVDGKEIAFTKDTYVLVKAGSKHHLDALTDISFLTIGIAIE